MENSRKTCVILSGDKSDQGNYRGAAGTKTAHPCTVWDRFLDNLFGWKNINEYRNHV